jgi:cytosolic carboxypeptidase protein 2/3
VKELTKWRRGGSRIAYTNSIVDDEYLSSYELRFSHFFRNNEHTCIEFAYAFPYGLKKLYAMIAHIKEHSTVSVLTKSFNGLDLPLLTIGNAQSKEVIVLSARVHPGETVSSFIMEGFLRELVGEN